VAGGDFFVVIEAIEYRFRAMQFEAETHDATAEL